jgi:hypothetical protein
MLCFRWLFFLFWLFRESCALFYRFRKPETTEDLGLYGLFVYCSRFFSFPSFYFFMFPSVWLLVLFFWYTVGYYENSETEYNMSCCTVIDNRVEYQGNMSWWDTGYN